MAHFPTAAAAVAAAISADSGQVAGDAKAG